MKLRTMVTVAAVGMALGGGAQASQYVFYDLEHDPRGVVGRDGVPALLEDIQAEWTSWAGHEVTLEPLQGNIEATSHGEGEVGSESATSGLGVDQSPVALQRFSLSGDTVALLDGGGDARLPPDGRAVQPSHDRFGDSRTGLTLASVPQASRLILIGIGLVVVGALARKLARSPSEGEVPGRRAQVSGAGRDALPTEGRGAAIQSDVDDGDRSRGPVYEVSRLVSSVSGEEPGTPSPKSPTVRYTQVEH
jgi:hypothetical protein